MGKFETSIKRSKAKVFQLQGASTHDFLTKYSAPVLRRGLHPRPSVPCPRNLHLQTCIWGPHRRRWLCDYAHGRVNQWPMDALCAHWSFRQKL